MATTTVLQGTTGVASVTTRKHKKKKKAINFVIAAFLLIYTIITLVPFYFMIVRSFVPTSMATEFHAWIPELPDFDMDAAYGDLATYYGLDLAKFKRDMGIEKGNYIDPFTSFNQIAEDFNIPEERIHSYLNPYVKYNGWISILTNPQFARSLLATVWVTCTSLTAGAFLGVCTGSVLAGLRKKWHGWIYRTYLLSIVIPPVMIMLPLYIIIRKLNLDNTYWALWFEFIKGNAAEIMLFTAYLSTIPRELEQSVVVDGGNRFQYFTYITLPLSKVVVASYLAIRFAKWWNDLLYGLLFLNPDKYTLIPFINSMQGTMSTNFQAMYAGLTISILPIIIFYLIFQKWFIRASLSGAVKG